MHTLRTRTMLFASTLVVMLAMSGSARAATITVNAGGDLQAALNKALPGDTILLQAGATFTGNFVLPKKSGTTFIIVRSSAANASLPAAGVRMNSSYAALLPKIKSPNTNSALKTATGAHHWQLQFLEFKANSGGYGEIIRLGSSSETSAANQPHHLLLDRLLIRGDSTLGSKRGIALNSADTSILNSQISNIKALGVDSQAIAGWNGPGPYLIENNFLEASGENIMFGGADPAIQGLVPANITIRRNLISKYAAWRSGQMWTVKNLLELKNAKLVMIEGNIFENCWKADQKGYAVLLTPTNGGAAPWTVVQDVTFRYNTVRHVGAALVVNGRDTSHGSGYTRNVLIANNVFTDVSTKWGGPGGFMVAGNGTRDVRVDHNTIDHDGFVVAGNGEANIGFVFTNNLARHNQWGIYGDNHGAGFDSINIYFPGIGMRRNVLAGGTASKYPTDNYFPASSTFLGNFVGAATGDFRLVTASPYVGMGTDGKNIGADITGLQAAQR